MSGRTPNVTWDRFCPHCTNSGIVFLDEPWVDEAGNPYALACPMCEIGERVALPMPDELRKDVGGAFPKEAVVREMTGTEHRRATWNGGLTGFHMVCRSCKMWRTEAAHNCAQALADQKSAAAKARPEFERLMKEYLGRTGPRRAAHMGDHLRTAEQQWMDLPPRDKSDVMLKGGGRDGWITRRAQQLQGKAGVSGAIPAPRLEGDRQHIAATAARRQAQQDRAPINDQSAVV